MNKILKAFLYVLFALYELLCLFMIIAIPDKGTKFFIVLLMLLAIFIFYIVYIKYKHPEKYQKLDEQVKKLSQTKKGEVQQRIAENKKNGLACCPKCGSISLSANKKGFGVGKAVVGSTIAGGLGLVAGNIGAKKVRITCLNCGHQFFPSK